MGQSDPQRTLFYQLSLETFVPAEHPLRAIRPLVDDRAIRRACRDLYSPIGRPSIPPEQLSLALVGGYLLGITSERKLVMELQPSPSARGRARYRVRSATRASRSRPVRKAESEVCFAAAARLGGPIIRPVHGAIR